jgi:hypothetical protein
MGNPVREVTDGRVQPRSVEILGRVARRQPQAAAKAARLAERRRCLDILETFPASAEVRAVLARVVERVRG